MVDDEMSFRNSKYVNYAVGTERSGNTEYKNNTDYTIHLSIMVVDSGSVAPLKIKVGDEYPVFARDMGGDKTNNWDLQFTAIIPPGVSYIVETNGNKIRSWSEMRYKGLK